MVEWIYAGLVFNIYRNRFCPTTGYGKICEIMNVGIGKGDIGPGNSYIMVPSMLNHGIVWYCNRSDFSPGTLQEYVESKQDPACSQCDGHWVFKKLDIQSGVVLVADLANHTRDDGVVEKVGTNLQRMDGRKTTFTNGCSGSKGSLRWDPPYWRDIVKKRRMKMRWKTGCPKEQLDFAKANHMWKSYNENISKKNNVGDSWQ